MALCASGQSGWAGLILDALGETGISTGSVVSWLQNNLGPLNIRIGSGYYLSGECILPDMSQNVSGIYTEMYFCSYFTKKANTTLGAAAYDWTEIVGEDQGSIRRVSKNELSKTYRLLGTDCYARLNELVDWYLDASGGEAYQVIYGDRYGGANFDLLPPPSCYSDYNFCWC